MIKKTYLTLTLVLLSVLCAAAQSQGVFSQSVYNTIDEFFPRTEGSVKEKKLVSFIKEHLQARNIDFMELSFEKSNLPHSFSSVLQVDIKGRRNDTFILCVPLNHPDDAGRESSGSINIMLALDLLDWANRNTLPVNLKILFLGAEFGSEGTYPLGSRLFLENFYAFRPACVLYLNFRNIPSKIILKHGANGIVSPAWLLGQTMAALSGLNFIAKSNMNQLYRIGLNQEETPITPYLQAGLPAICLEGSYNSVSEEEREGWYKKSYNFLINLISSFKQGINSDWDLHYLFLQFFNNFIIVPEYAFLIILLVIAALFIIYTLIYYKRFLYYIRLLFRKSWVLIIFYLVTLLSVLAGTSIIVALGLLKNSNELWARFPLIFFLLKISTLVLLFLFFYPLINKLPLSKNKNFYFLAAFFLTLLDIMVLAAIDISFTYYFVWAFFMLLAAFAVRHKVLRFLFKLLAPVLLVQITLDLFLIPELRFCRIFLISPLKGDFLLSLFLLPFILIFYDLKLFFDFTIAVKRKIKFYATMGLALSILILILVPVIVSPYSTDNPQKIQFTQSVDLDQKQSQLSLVSNAPLGKIKLSNDESNLFVDTLDSSIVIPYEKPYPELGIKIKQSPILDRDKIQIMIEPFRPPYTLALTLSSNQEFLIYDTNFRAVKNIQGNQYDFQIGKRPPVPFTLSLVLPKDQYYILKIKIDYLETPNKLEVKGTNKEVEKHYRLIKTFQFKT